MIATYFQNNSRKSLENNFPELHCTEKLWKYFCWISLEIFKNIFLDFTAKKFKTNLMQWRTFFWKFFESIFHPMQDVKNLLE
jgi:hypothetical protein